MRVFKRMCLLQNQQQSMCLNLGCAKINIEMTTKELLLDTEKPLIAALGYLEG
jgi:hypothetical protein